MDNASPDAPRDLEKLAEQGVEGVRFTAVSRWSGADPLGIWRKAQELGLVASVMGSVEDYASPEFEALVQELSDLKIVIEHLGGVGAFWGPGRGDKTIPYETYRSVLELAKYPNTYIKIPGLGEFCARPVPFQQPFPFVDVPPLIQMAVDAFGANRSMWGSDFPPVAAREGYRQSLQHPRDQLKDSYPQDREMIFGGTAASLWRFGN